MKALIILKSGQVNLHGCSLSVEAVRKNNVYKYRIPCIYQHPLTTTFITRCVLRGGGPEKADSCGVFNNMGNSVIQNSHFSYF